MSSLPETDEDAQWMLRVKRGGSDAPEALAQLVERWKQPVIHFLFRSLPDAEEAEDLALIVFTQLWKSAARYQISARFSTFLFTIARNLCLNELRRRARHPAVSLDEPHGDDEAHPFRQIEDAREVSADVLMQRGELVSKINEALAALPEKQRTAIILCRDTDLSYDEIAEILGTSVPATKSLIHRGREVLRMRLKPYLKTGEWNPPPSH
jgi:RNA polymerase sigma-70 factor, ECF subfamily